MEKCEHTDHCPFYNGKIVVNEQVFELCRDRYCRGEKNQCARYIVRTRMSFHWVPSDLLPGEISRAMDLVGDF